MINRIECQLRSTLKRENINEDRLERHLKKRKQFISNIIDGRFEYLDEEKCLVDHYYFENKFAEGKF